MDWTGLAWTGVGWTVVPSPIGPLTLGADDAGVCAVRFPPADAPAVDAPADGAPADGSAGLLARTADQLGRYFAGELTAFTVPLSIRRGSAFERAVWHELTSIPYGETRTYGAVAAAVGDSGAARAVGVACNRNPLPLLIPCHRVVGAGNRLVGFGGGLPRKRHLLELEAGVRLRQAWS